MIGFIGTCITITITYNSSQSVSKTRSIPSWTTSGFSSTVVDYNYDCLRLTNFSPCLVRPPFITSGEPERNHRLQGCHYRCSGMCCVGNVCDSVATVR
jgi:hypothetical protein